MSEERRAIEAVYAELVRLRRAGAAEAPGAAHFRALAAELPGALRLLDRMPMAELEARHATLARGETRPWVEATIAWRRVMRQALAVRRAAGRDRSLEGARSGHALSAAEAEAIVRPAGGRLVPWALGQVACALDRSPREVEAEVFGAGADRASQVGARDVR